MIRTSTIVATLMLTFGLTGCSLFGGQESANESSATDPGMPDTSAVPVEEIEPAAETVKMPATCDELISPETVQLADPRLESFHENAREHVESMLGPKTVAALAGGTHTMYCEWGIPGSDAVAPLAVTILDEPARSDLIAALSDSVYAEVTAEYAMNGVVVDAVFEQGGNSEHRYTDEIIFDESVLIATAHTIEGDFAVYALDAVRELNAVG